MMAAILSHKSANFLAIVLLGLSSFSGRCDARAVNVSNTWTMPQEGLNVFYRFFRDRISWFEADAVCQFHHANLVTVDNSFQFDATRDLLRELDVNDIVWIGLMRPQNGDRFMWSNSRPLVADTGYWAESLPLMDAPLCAVIDPIRDYRWHALRCGGPETASFLCEMPVPSWAEACILRDMPNLTMQYMADTASVELIRNCEEEGLIRQSCKSKQDRERVIRELICPRERLEAQRINDITNSHFKSLQIINSIRTDNNENNDIELLPLGQSYETNRDFAEEVQTEKNTVQRLIEQFNVDELMQADEPINMNGNGFIIPGEIPKPVKKTSKKVIINADAVYPPKKDKFQKTKKQQQQQPQPQQPIALEDMMMGDQPMQQGEPEVPESHTIDDDVTNEIMEPLPHKKKILPQDLRTMPTITERPSFNVDEQEAEEKQREETETEAEAAEVEQNDDEKANNNAAATIITNTASTTTHPYFHPGTSTTNTTSTTTTKTITRTAAIHAPTQNADVIPSIIGSSMSPMMVVDAEATLLSSSLGDSSTIHPHGTVLPIATIGHPMHPQQPRSNIITEETQHLHVKESADNSHFIPPLLMVKSHYVPPNKHGEHAGEHHDVENGGEHHQHQHEYEHEHEHVHGQGHEHDYEHNHHEHHEHVDHLEVTASATATDDVEIIKETNVSEGQATQIGTTTKEPSSTTTEPETHAKMIEQPLMPLNIATNEQKKASASAVPLHTNQTAENKEIKLNAGTTTTSTTTTTTTTQASTLKPLELVTSNVEQQKEITITSRPNSANDATEAETMKSLTETTTARQTTNNVDRTTTTSTTTTTTTETTTASKVTTKDMTITTEQSEIQKILATASAGKVDKQETSTSPPPPPSAPATSDIVAATTLVTSQPITTSTLVAATAPTTTTTTTKTTTTTTTSIPLQSTPTTIITTGKAIEATSSDAPVTATTTTTAAATPIMTTTTSTTTTTTDAPPALTSTHNFLKEDTETPFKPNRRRSLTKPETVSYFKKILG